MSSQPPQPSWTDQFNTGPPVLPALWAARWSIILWAVLCALLGFSLSSLQSDRYEATAQLLLSDPRNAGVFEDTGVNFLDPSRYVRNQAELARSVSVMREASAVVGGRISPEDLSDRVTIRPSVDLDLLSITAMDGTAAGAANLANAVADGYQIVVERQVEERTSASLDQLREQRVQLEEGIAEAEAQIEMGNIPTGTAARDGAIQQLLTINNRMDQIAVDASLFGAGVDLAEKAEVPDDPTSPQPARNGALALVLGGLAASGIAWWRAEENETVADRNDPTKVLRVPLLGTVPSFEEAHVDSQLPTISSPTGPVSESYQFLVNSIAHALEEAGGHSFLITSAGPTDGKTLTAANLGIAAARDGRQVLLVDADTRVRGLTKLFDVDANNGLDSLAGGAHLSDVVTLLDAGDHHATLLPAVSLGEDTAAFFRTPSFRRISRELDGAADFVIYDTPPLLLASDTSAIAGHVVGLVVVVARGTSVRQLREMRERLDRLSTPTIGYIFTKDKLGSGYGYQYGYAEYGRSEND